MDKFSASEDIYEELVENSNDHWILGLVAFAIIEEQRIEWMKHQNSNNGVLPTSEEVKNWYEQQPKAALLRAKDTAESRLKDYSNEIVDLIMEDQKKEIEEGIIVSEIRNANKFLPQLGVNIFGGLASALIFAALLTIVAFFVLHGTSPTELGKDIREKAEVIDNG